MIDIYGTIGPACADFETLRRMFSCGMTGIRLNTSHVSVRQALSQITLIRQAAEEFGITPRILIDLQGPELRVGKIPAPLQLVPNQKVQISCGEIPDSIPVPDAVLSAVCKNDELLLDDGRLLVRMDTATEGTVVRGGLLRGGKSIAVSGREILCPAMTEQDKINICDAVKCGVTDVMQPFVRSVQDLREVRAFMNQNNGSKMALLAKIEDMSGVRNLTSFLGMADEIVIARGDLGNAMPLWELPRVQKYIAKTCNDFGVPFMVVTQMLTSMEHSPVPTRAEVSDIYNAVSDGASSVMVTGETAMGEYPVEVIRYLANTVRSFESRDMLV